MNKFLLAWLLFWCSSQTQAVLYGYTVMYLNGKRFTLLWGENQDFENCRWTSLQQEALLKRHKRFSNEAIVVEDIVSLTGNDILYRPLGELSFRLRNGHIQSGPSVVASPLFNVVNKLCDQDRESKKEGMTIINSEFRVNGAEEWYPGVIQEINGYRSSIAAFRGFYGRICQSAESTWKKRFQQQDDDLSLYLRNEKTDFNDDLLVARYISHLEPLMGDNLVDGCLIVGRRDTMSQVHSLLRQAGAMVIGGNKYTVYDGKYRPLESFEVMYAGRGAPPNENWLKIPNHPKGFGINFLKKLAGFVGSV
jgi:hypothetical protein